MHPNAQYWIGNYFFVILFTFYWYFMVKLLSFLFSTTFFFNKFYSFVAQKILWQTLVQSSVAKRISEHKNRKKSTKYYQISKQMIRVDEYVLIEELRLRYITVMRCDPAPAWVNCPLKVKIFTENITVKFIINL